MTNETIYLFIHNVYNCYKVMEKGDKYLKDTMSQYYCMKSSEAVKVRNSM